MTDKEFVIKHYPSAKVEDDGLFYCIIVDTNGLGFEECISKGFTEDRAWELAAEGLGYELD